MTIMFVGINHKTTPVAIREKITYDDLFEKISAQYFPHLLSEFIILSTCNRTEIYAVTAEKKQAEESLKKLFKLEDLFVYTDFEAVKHLYEVASGIDSQILGESEIMSQVREAYKNGREKQTVGVFLHQLLKESLRVGKIARTKTLIGVGIRSLPQAALHVAQKQLGQLSEQKILILGAGVIARKLFLYLTKKGLTNTIVINRTYQKAVALAGGQARKIEDLEACLEKSDVVISATASPSVLIKASLVMRAMKKRNERPLCLIDLAVPRDIEEHVSTLQNVSLYNIDEVQEVLDLNATKRKKEITAVRKIVDEEADRFWNWFQERKTVPLLTALQQHATSIRDTELKKAFNKLNHLQLNEHDKNIIALLALRIENKLLAKPIVNLKKGSVKRDGDEYVTVVKELFEL